MIPITVIILTKNEIANISETIQSVSQFDDIIVVDSGSADGTPEVARLNGARVVDFAWDGNYPKKKQWAIDNTRPKNQWVLLLDADERPTPALISELRQLITSGQRLHDAYDIRLQYRFAGKILKHGHRVTKRSFLNSQTTRFPEVPDLDAPGIREVEGHYQPQTNGSIGALTGEILHDDKDLLTDWFNRHNKYSDWEAHLNLHPSAKRAIAGYRTGKGQAFDRMPLKPAAFFIYSYLARRGFLDGRAGFDYAFALAHYYWQIAIKTRELRTHRR